MSQRTSPFQSSIFRFMKAFTTELVLTFPNNEITWTTLSSVHRATIVQPGISLVKNRGLQLAEISAYLCSSTSNIPALDFSCSHELLERSRHGFEYIRSQSIQGERWKPHVWYICMLALIYRHWLPSISFFSWEEKRPGCLLENSLLRESIICMLMPWLLGRVRQRW